MPRFLLALAAAAVGSAASAHFVYLVPAADGRVRAVFSDSLDPDDGVPLAKYAALKSLTVVSADGSKTTIETKPAGDHLTADLPKAARLAHGTLVYGVSGKGDKPALLVYHPKAVFGKADPAALTTGAELEAVPEWTPKGLRFRLLAAGKPVAGAAGSVLTPDGDKAAVTTDADGYTQPFPAAGRYGVWLRQTTPTAGDHAGQKYAEVKRYATLVADNNK